MVFRTLASCCVALVAILQLGCWDAPPLYEGMPEHVKRRHVALEGAPNFRDLGGYATEDGREVKWGLFYRSDNATLARLGVPAHSISTTPIDVDPDYHQPSDEVSTLDLEHMTNTIRAIAMGAETIITGDATPTRVDPATVNR